MHFKDTRIINIKTTDDMLIILKSNGNPLHFYKKGTVIQIYNKMVRKGSYILTAEPGKDFAADFIPILSPGEMLSLGVFEGKYLNDCLLEFPMEWFLHAIMLGKLCPGKSDASVNYFGIYSRQPLSIWKKNKWIYSSKSNNNVDERGWFQWYCRYWMGRRIPDIDDIQIKRWKAFARHDGQIRANCKSHDLQCRPRQRQALLQWARNCWL